MLFLRIAPKRRQRTQRFETKEANRILKSSSLTFKLPLLLSFPSVPKNCNPHQIIKLAIEYQMQQLFNNSSLVISLLLFLTILSLSSLIEAVTTNLQLCTVDGVDIINQYNPDSHLSIVSFGNESCSVTILNTVVYSIEFIQSIKGGFIFISNVTCVSNTSSCVTFSGSGTSTLAEMSYVVIENVKMLPVFFSEDRSLGSVRSSLVEIIDWNIGDFSPSTSSAQKTEFRISHCLIKANFSAGLEDPSSTSEITFNLFSGSGYMFRSIDKFIIENNTIDVNFVSCYSIPGNC